MESEKLQSERDQRGASFHEAGHAVAAWLLGLAVGGVEIAIDDDDAKGVAHVQEAAHLDILDQLAICAAGMEAQKLFDAPTHEGAGWSDYGRMLELLDDDLEESERKRLVDDGHQRAYELLRPHLDKIERLGTALLERKRLDAEEVRALLEII